MVCRSSFSITAMDRKFSHRLKYLSREQRLRAGKMASSWESLIPHRSKSSSWRVASTFSSRMRRSSGLKSVMVTPLRPRPFSWLMFGLWDRWVKSDSVSQQLVIDRLSKGDFRHLGRNQAISSWELGCQLHTADRQKVSTGLSFVWSSVLRISTLMRQSYPSLSLVTSLLYWVTS